MGWAMQICVRSMAKCDVVIPMIAAMKRRGDAIHIAAETIKKMYDLNIPELVACTGEWQVHGSTVLHPNLCVHLVLQCILADNVVAMETLQLGLCVLPNLLVLICN